MKTVEHGILLRRINYSETSLILHFFTLEDGFQAYIFQGGRKKKGNLLQPLSMVELTSYRRPESELGKITEISADFVPQSIPFHPVKSGLAFYITEVLSQVLQKSEKDEKMYRFIESEIQWLDTSNELTNYPIWFFLKLGEELGIGVQIENPQGQIFDIQEGIITNQTPQSPYYFKGEIISVFKEILQLEKTMLLAHYISKENRRDIMESLTDYFKYHIHGFKDTKSLEVMQMIFE